MKYSRLKSKWLSATFLAGSSVLVAFPIHAQETVEQTIPETERVAEDILEEREDAIVVTGSRIKRDTFSSISPIQVIRTSTQIKAGLLDTATILQTDESASGVQIDATFQGFVLDNGPASQTIDLRGLGPERTLVLINGRRVAPSGVEGAPISPSINQIPTSLLDRTELLLDGASSVYGSDAVAGVVNLILRKDFEGLEVFGSTGVTQQGGNIDYTLSAAWGTNTDRGFFGIGAEYDFQDEVTLGDRDFLEGCERHVEIDQNGNIRNTSISDDTLYQEWFGGFRAAPESTNECLTTGIVGRIFETSSTFGSIYFVDDGFTNIGIPGFIDQTLSSVPIDADGDGVQDFGFNRFSTNGNVDDTSFIREQERINIFTYGEYTFEGENNITPFFEAMYTHIESDANTGAPQLFPTVGANNPFNPCGVNGIDCGLAAISVISDPAFRERFNTYFRDRDPNRDGDERDARVCVTFLGGAFDNANCNPEAFELDIPVGPVDVEPVLAIRGDRDNSSVSINNFRGVFGVKGDLPFINYGDLSGWAFEASLIYSESNGTSLITGIRDDRLNFSLGNDLETGNPNGSAPCTAPAGVEIPVDVSAGCVPVNLFVPTFSEELVTDFASQAERDYLLGVRVFDTEIKQSVWSAFLTGTLLEGPSGDINAVFGGEIRIDELASNPNNLARDGLLFGFTQDGGAQGKKTTKELFVEINVPLAADIPFFDKLEANISGRLTDDEFYGTNYTYSLKSGWQISSALSLKASYGTSFRAPNLRENFLAGQTGFNTFFDPCIVPDDAVSEFNNVVTYDPSQDERDPNVLARCVREGVDPTTLGGDGASGLVNAEISTSGSLDINPETSSALTLGFAFEQPFTDWLDLNIAANYYNIEVRDAIISPSGQFLIFDCFLGDQPVTVVGLSCARISRDNDGMIDFLQGGFLNRDREQIRGVDINAQLSKEFQAFDKPMDLDIEFRANRIIERSTREVDDAGTISIDRREGEFGFPKWSARIGANLEIDNKWEFFWQTRWIGQVEQDADSIDDFGSVFGVDTDGDGIGDAVSDTCAGPVTGDVLCRDVGFADDYFVHTASVEYNADTWTITVGISNLFNNAPPEVDSSEVFSVSNVPLGTGYNIDGRRFFFNVRKRF